MTTSSAMKGSEEECKLGAQVANPIIKQQQELYFSKYQRHLTNAQLKDLVERIVILQQLYFQDTEIQCKYDNVEYWESISDGLHVTKSIKSNSALGSNLYVSKNADIASSIATINNKGYDVISFNSPKTENNSGKAAPNHEQLFTKIQNTIKNLRKEGFPPSFIFVYDEIWFDIIINLFDVYSILLNDDNVHMESDLNCWSLQRPAHAPGYSSTSEIPTPYIGQSFNQSHRDMKYSNCHDIDTEAFTSLNCWIPLNPIGATNRNGCMNVVPVEYDDFFYDYTHIYHMQTKKTLQFMDDNNKELAKDNIEVIPYHRELVCKAGDVCTWVPSLIHWGGKCQHECIEPRISIAMTFRKSGAKQSVYGSIDQENKEENSDATSDEEKEPKPVQRKDIFNLTMSQRLGYVAKSIISYAHWYPGLPGLSLQRLQKGSSF